MSSDKPEKTEPTDDEVNSSGAEPDEPLDPTLDVTSKQFDPLKALYSKTKHIPVKNAKIYDNISKLQSFLARKASSTETVVLLASSTSKPSTSKAATDADNPFKRRFLPHQMMVQGPGPKKRFTRNLLKSLETGECIEGPMRALKTFVDDKKRVKIYTRNEHGVRGYITGFVVLFDKHWNMVVTDVLEVWKRRKAHYCQPAAQPVSTATDECARRLKELQITVPDITVKSLNRKNIECSRRVAEMLVRGENVVCVMLADRKL